MTENLPALSTNPLPDNVQAGVNPRGALDRQRPPILRAYIEYMAGDKVPKEFERGNVTITDGSEAFQVESLKLVWIATRRLQKWATDYPADPKVFCASYDGYLPEIGEDKQIGPCAKDNEDGERVAVCPKGQWTAKCPKDKNHVIPFSHYRTCPECDTKLTKSPPICRQILIGLFFMPDFEKFCTIQFWKTAESALPNLFQQMKLYAQKDYQVARDQLPLGLTITFVPEPKKIYFVPTFPRVLSDGSSGWVRTNSSLYNELIKGYQIVVDTFASIPFFGSEDAKNGKEDNEDGKKDGIPF